MTVSPLKDDLGLLGNGPQAVNLLTGQYSQQLEVETGVENILAHLQLKEGHKLYVQPTPISREELVTGWKKVKERTSSSP